ncbi:MAG TPA: biotin carboxylase N-terminal domain-containing protein [Baekduia sp.]|uniref:acetyl/propionyl/methylcrotonyl-CoA carboxylase subunit alpha n=1 Tax=Baekduia sp. TaxID=2600305 RepID=UPI002D781369|nr:biotin carboxylase N-terminal domain-containing protein [Baekduia sp.]HET6508115.1 biotin carboxylase N-terminal domain-containing protein [Baekduia sp.]
MSLRDLGPVLIANRGEIAIRVARTAHALGLRTVGVVTEADAGAAHADATDTTVSIASYLDADELLRAARAAGARSVHPGYGFLSENAAFARVVADAGLTWIGPPPSAIELMGDKGAAKDAASAAGVPVVPSGDDGGYPVVVKAVAGGGGKGMRVVRAAEELEEATAAAQREARAAFGDDRVIVERYLERPRHIEIQVLADARGTVLHLGERECSLQRRHQKVVEEAPSPVVGADLRARMGDAAVALASACGYVGAGTVEFIAPGDASEFFFLEMNTRLQVEHPVTELVYGVDLVEQQLRVAAGEPLALAQDDLVPRGHAVEARLYAEDPVNGFLPATGTVRVYDEPTDRGVRVDSGIRAGSVVGTSYDPMLAKVVAHADDRATALDRLDRALATLAIAGVTTNAAFTRALIARDDVRAGEMDTNLLERVLEELAPPPPDDLLAAAMLAAAGTATPAGPWRRALADGLGEARVADGTVAVGERRWEGAAVRATGDGRFAVTLDGVTRRYAIALDGEDAVHVARDGHHATVRTARPDRSGAALPEGSLEAPMPGTVWAVNVANGDAVREGDVLIVLESMKMELSITAPRDGVIEGLALSPGDRVALKQPLVAVVEEETA